MLSDLPFELRTLGQLLLALVLGFAIGWERESAGKWAGLRTHLLLIAASVLFVRLGIVLISSFDDQTKTELLRSDPIRILEALVTGIAFIGAGTIFRDRSRLQMRGLTTAASLLTTGAIGVAVALNQIVIAIGSTLIALVILRTLHRFENKQLD